MKDPVPHSIIDASKYFVPRYADKTVICACSVDECERMAPDPFTIYLHQQMMHKMSAGKVILYTL